MNGSNMENEKTPLYVAFSTQKGGVGKTTFTVLAASYLYYLKGYDVAVVDCDYPQHSIAGMRKRLVSGIKVFISGSSSSLMVLS